MFSIHKRMFSVTRGGVGILLICPLLRCPRPPCACHPCPRGLPAHFPFQERFALTRKPRGGTGPPTRGPSSRSPYGGVGGSATSVLRPDFLFLPRAPAGTHAAAGPVTRSWSAAPQGWDVSQTPVFASLMLLRTSRVFP